MGGRSWAAHGAECGGHLEELAFKLNSAAEEEGREERFQTREARAQAGSGV